MIKCKWLTPFLARLDTEGRDARLALPLKIVQYGQLTYSNTKAYRAYLMLHSQSNPGRHDFEDYLEFINDGDLSV